MDILIRELDPGQKYIFQARSKSASGKTSAWSTAFEHITTSDTIAPNPVTSLTWDCIDTSFVATWIKPVTDSNGKPLKDFKDYKITLTADAQTVVYFVQQEKFDFTLEANRNSFGSAKPEIDITVQVRDLTGNLSNGVTDSAANVVPSDVTGLIAEGTVNGITLTWDQISDNDLKYYQVYMSTSGAGFTPGLSNIVYTGLATNFVLPSTNYVTHYFKVRAVDVFDQGSVNYATANAVPDSSSSVDLTPPDDPSGVTVSTTSTEDGYASLLVEWSPVVSSNLSDYIVRYSVDEVIWIYVTIPAGQEDAIINGLQPDIDYYVQVAAMSYANVKSDFVNATPYPITSAADTTAPSQPSAPSVSTTTLAAQVSHDMTKQGGGDLETDVDYLEVHASVSSGFTPNNTTLRGTINTAGQGIDVSGLFYFPSTDSTSDLYWKVIAVDRAKNKSIASNQSNSVPGLILNANIGNATITSAKINDLEAHKITAGTGIINDLLIKSTLTIDTAGHLQSTNWNGTDTGYKLDTNGLTIYSGTISAEALLLQDSANVMPPAFADFEFNEDYYQSDGTINTVVWSSVGTGITVDIVETGQKFGNKCLRILNGAITNPTVHDLIFAPSGLSATGVNIDVSPGTYIFSGYFKKNGSVDALLKFGFYPESGSAIVSSNFTVSSTSWTRFEAQLVIPSGITKMKAYLEFGPATANTGYDMLIDGLQVERKMTGATTAGPWKPPSKTVIDGGQIVTGSIRSNAMSSVAPTQPAWSINTAGNMQIGDALVRGSITVGSTTAPQNLIPDQFTSFENTSSYYHDGSNVQNSDNFQAVNLSATPNTKLEIISDSVYGTQALRMFETAAPTSGNSRGITFTNLRLNPAGNNINVIAGRDYWISAYFKNRDVTKQVKVGFAVYSDNASFVTAMGIVGGDVDISSSTSGYTRVYGKWTAPAGRSNCQIDLFITPIGGSTGFDISMDGFMFELGYLGQTGPSTYTDSVGELSYVRSGNYISGLSGWSIGNDGTAEFNDGFFRGQLDISAFFNNETYGTNVSNLAAVWKSRNWSSYATYEVAGIEPAIKLSGTGFKPTSAGGLQTTNPFQVLFRGSPEGGYQLMADGTDSERIYNVDANNDLTSSFLDIQDVYGYSDLRAGRGYNRDFTAAAANNLLTADNMYYTQLQTKSQLWDLENFAQQKTGFWSRTDASPLSYEFFPVSQTKYSADSQVTLHVNRGNLIPDFWDLIDTAVGTLNTNSVRNRIQLNSTGTLYSLYAPTTSSTATSNLINVVNATFLSAGTGDSLIWLSTSDTTYNVTVESGCEYSMGMQFALPTSLIGKQFQFVMKLSNGTILTSTLTTLTSDNIGLTTVANTKLSMGYANVFTIPAGITSCLVGFKIIGGVASNTNFSFGAGLLYKTRNADGTYTATYNKQLQVPRGYTNTYTSTAYVKTGASALPPEIYYDNDRYANAMAKIDLYTESYNAVSGLKQFATNISPNGMQWGVNTEYRPQHGMSIRTTTANIPITNATFIDIPTTTGSPAAFNLVTTNGTNMATDWNSAGATYTTSAPVGLLAKRAGLYLVHVWVSTASSATAQFLEIHNATTSTRYGLSMLPGPAEDFSLTAIVPCSATDRIVVRYVNFSGATRTLGQYRISMAQII
jgi:hypothetical protein